MIMNILTKDIKNVISNDKKDKNIEVFWLDFKKIAYTFIERNNLDISIDEWSVILNDYKKRNKIDDIIKSIQIFISLFFIYIFKQKDSYNTSILWCHIKKWNKINKNYYIFDKYYFKVSYLLLDLFNSILINNLSKSNEIFNFFYKINKDFSKDEMFSLIDLLFKYNIDLRHKFLKNEELINYYNSKF